MNREVAAFDVDGTLTVRDCVVPFMARVAGRARCATMLGSSLLTSPRGLVAMDRDSLKERLVKSVFTGRDAEIVARAGEQFAQEIYGGWMRRDTATRLRWHQSRGHAVVLVSASLEPYLAPLGRLLGVDGVLCTRLEEVDGVLTGRLVGPNCRGAEKMQRLRSWLSDSNLPGEQVHYAYGDSRGDLEMLRSAVGGLNVRRVEIPRTP